MSDRRGSRFVLEVLFLLALAVALTLAKLDPLEIGGVMLVGWVIVALFEWAAWRNEPHYGSGLPPRYYVPRVDLPPAQPLEQVPTYPDTGYPEAREEAPTWIAPAALRAEVLGDWPMALRVEDEEEEEKELEQHEQHEEPAPVATEEPADTVDDPEPQLELEPDDPWVVEELPAEPLAPAPQLEAVLTRSVQGMARYSLDPLADPPPKRRFGRGGGEEAPAVEVPARPEGVRALPGRSIRED